MLRGLKIKKVRLNLFMTLEDVYLKSKRKMDVSRLSKLERGITLPTSRDKKILSRVFKLSEEELFPENQ